ncbi:MAG: OmpA family protein, partial [Bacteroidota bacterium]
TRDFDSYSTTTLGIHFRLGPGEESLWWNNPLTEVYSSAREAVNIVSRLTDDADDDGVPDLYDLEPDTPVGMIVDSQGRVQDSDGDGYPDSQDDQPYTPKGCDVDNKGVALDSDADGVPDCFDKEPDSAPGVLVDAKGITIPIINPDTLQFETPCILPVVYFELDKDVVAPQFYPQLNYIAQLMKSDSKLKIKATGFSDSRSSDDYNLQLSKRRVDNTVSFIANTFGIDPTRFEKDYKGEANAVIPNLPANKSNPKLEPLHYVNRRVEFDCVK